MKKIRIFILGIFIIGFVSFIFILKTQGLSLKETPKSVIRSVYTSPDNAIKGDYKKYTTLGINKPIEKKNDYINPFTKRVLYIDRSMANRCCEQPSYTFYIDEVDKVFWIGYYQASIGSKHSGTFGPFKYTTILTKTDKCVESNEQCREKPDGTECNLGVWCDEEGKICGGQSCVGLSLGECNNEKCELIK